MLLCITLPLQWIALLAILSGATTPATKPTPDETRIQGRWHCVEQIDVHGKRSEPKLITEYSFEGDKFFSFSEGEKRELGRFRLNSQASPKEMDWFPVSDDPGHFDEARAWKGIYALDGDNLQFTMSLNGERPKGLDGDRRNGTLNTLKRMK